jgi:hypothetical protein
LKNFADFLNVRLSNIFSIVDIIDISHEDSVLVIDEVERALNAVRNVNNVYKATDS